MVDIWRRATGNLLNSAYYDPSFTMASDVEDPMVIINLDISNAFGILHVRLVLDHLSGRASRDYVCVINTDTDFETTVHELKYYFGFFRLHHICETILRFYSYDGSTNYVRCRTGGLQGDSPEFMIFCLVTLHLWGHIFGKFPEIKDLTYTDDDNIIVKLSTVLKFISMLDPVFKKDVNLVLNISKTKVLAKGPSADHLFERAKHFLDTDPDLVDIAYHFTRDMFTTPIYMLLLCDTLPLKINAVKADRICNLTSYLVK